MVEKRKAVAITMASIIALLLVGQSVNILIGNDITPPDVNLESNVNLIDVGDSVEFEISPTSSSGDITKIAWVFNDGTSAQYSSDDPRGTNLKIEHTFNVQGEFLVSALVIGEGNTNIIKTVLITVKNQEGNADFTPSETNIFTEGETIQFDATKSQDVDDNFNELRFLWQFGDGITSTESIVNYSYNESGVYPVTLYVFDDQNAVDAVTHFVTIQNAQPVADFSFSTNNFIEDGDLLKIFLHEDELLTVDASPSKDSGNDYNILEYYWQFGDQSTINAKSTTHSYSEKGEYDLKLTVIDDNGVKSVKEALVIVSNEIPTINFQKSSYNIDEGSSIFLSPKVTDSPSDIAIMKYDWSFDHSLTGESAVYTAFDNLDDKISVNATDNNNVKSITTSDIKVNNLVPDAWITSTSINANLTMTVTGEKYHDVNFVIYNDTSLYLNETILREAGDPNLKAISKLIELDMRFNWTIRVEYTPLDDPENGQIEGANPTTLNFTVASEGISQSLNRTFNYNKPNEWIWILDLNNESIHLPVTYGIQYHDPGQDDLTINLRKNGSIIASKYISSETSSVGNSGFVGLTAIADAIGSLELEIIDDDDASKVRQYEILANLGFDNSDLLPFIQINTPTEPIMDQLYQFNATIIDSVSNGKFNITWKIGGKLVPINNTIASFNISNPGYYLLELTLDYPHTQLKFGNFINIKNIDPTFQLSSHYTVYENQALNLQPFVDDTVSDKESLKYHWSFGDDQFSYFKNINHRYEKSGHYTASFSVIDKHGSELKHNFVVEVIDREAEINIDQLASTSEGTFFSLTPAISDSPYDKLNYNYKWKFQNTETQSKLFSTFLDDGQYIAEFSLTERGNTIKSKTVDITIDNIPPAVLSPPPTRFYGADTDKYIDTYFIDSFLDIDDLVVTWTVTDISRSSQSNKFKHTIPMNFIKTQSVTLDISVSDDAGDSSSNSILIPVALDDDGDGIFNGFEINSNPNDPDSDGDFLNDNHEVQLGTNPLAVDTDGDGLYDGFGSLLGTGEIPLGTNPNVRDTDTDGLIDGEELIPYRVIAETESISIDTEVISDPTKDNSDSDELLDDVERALGLNPMDEDTDDDGLLDHEEIELGTNPLHYDSDKDGLSDKSELDGYNVHYRDANYNVQEPHTQTDPNNPDTDGDGFKDLWERHRRYDGNNTDTDRDGVNDDSEKFTQKFDQGKRGTIRIFSFEGFEVVPGTQTIEIDVEDIGGASQFRINVVFTKLQIDGDLTLTVMEGGNSYITDIFNSDKSEFSASYDISDDISKYNYDGVWEIKLEGLAIIFLEDINIEVTTNSKIDQVDSDRDGLTDGEEITASDAWGTNPVKSDTDFDLVSDLEEINNNQSPHLKDTDGDTVLDRDDISPTGNVMLKMTIDWAYWDHNCLLGDPNLAVIVSMDNLNSYITPFVEADEASRSCVKIGSLERRAQIDSTYYFDVGDGQTSQDYNIRLYEGDLLIDDLVQFPTATFSWDEVGDSYSDTFISSDTYKRVKFEIEVVKIDKARTIAIHEGDDLEGDHYDDPNASYYLMYVKTDSNQDWNNVDGRVFYGNRLYTIVIPQSIFINTQLNELIQSEDIDNMPSGLKTAKFIGLSDSSSVSENVEGIINLGEISGNAAYDVLKLVLFDSITDERSYSQSYYYNDGAELNLPVDVVKLLPWNGISNSAVSDDPPGTIIDDLKDTFNAIVNVFVGGVKLIVGGLIAIGNFIVDVVDAVIEFGHNLVGVIEEAAEAVKKAVQYVLIVVAKVVKEFIKLAFSGIVFLMESISSEVVDDDAVNGSGTSISVNIQNYQFSLSVSFPEIEVTAFDDLILPHFRLNVGIMAPSGVSFATEITQGLLNAWDVDLDSNTILPTIKTSNQLSLQNTLNVDADHEFNWNEFTSGIDGTNKWSKISTLLFLAGFTAPKPHDKTLKYAGVASPIPIQAGLLIHHSWQEYSSELLLGQATAVFMNVAVIFLSLSGKNPFATENTNAILLGYAVDFIDAVKYITDDFDGVVAEIASNVIEVVKNSGSLLIGAGSVAAKAAANDKGLMQIMGGSYAFMGIMALIAGFGIGWR